MILEIVDWFAPVVFSISCLFLFLFFLCFYYFDSFKSNSTNKFYIVFDYLSVSYRLQNFNNAIVHRFTLHAKCSTQFGLYTHVMIHLCLSEKLLA